MALIEFKVSVAKEEKNENKCFLGPPCFFFKESVSDEKYFLPQGRCGQILRFAQLAFLRCHGVAAPPTHLSYLSTTEQENSTSHVFVNLEPKTTSESSKRVFSYVENLL